MQDSQPHIPSADGRRRFACSPVALLVYVVDELERVLLLEHPGYAGWQVINGALESGETVLDGALREMREEAGEHLRVTPLGTVHASSFHYDDDVRFMISIGYVMAYDGGEVEPGDDMAGSAVRWCSLEDLHDLQLLVPPMQRWQVERAVELFRLWKGREMELQPPL